jgi:hypothetical protein
MGRKIKGSSMKLIYKGIYKKRRINDLNTKDFQGELKIIFIKRRT